MELLPRLAECADYRAFAKAYFEGGDTYAAFGRRAGFLSRSFPRDIAVGKRRLSASSLPKFAKALKLPPLAIDYFRHLVARDESDAREFLGLSATQLEKKIAQLREKILALGIASTRSRRDFGNRDSNSLDNLLSVPQLNPIYAALGAPQTGADIAEIAQRTGMSEAKAALTLAEMVSRKLCRFDEDSGRYHPEELHLNLEGAGKSLFFRRLFENSAVTAMRRSEKAFESKEELFFCSSLTIDREKMPALKAKLRELLLSFVDESVVADGNQVTNLTVALNLPSF